MNIFRRLPLSRLLLLCGLAVALGISATAIASALGSAPAPAPKPLATAIHDALAGPSVEGVSANIKLTDHLLEGANIAGDAGGPAGAALSNPLLSGADGRLWVAKDGRVRLELQSEKGDTQVIYDGHALLVYDGAANTLYRYVPEHQPAASQEDGTQHEVPSVAKIEEAIAHVSEHAAVSGATPTDVGGQPAYTVRVSPKESGSLIGGAELSFDAVHGTPLRAAVYSSTSSSPVVELSATDVSYGPVSDSVFAFTTPPGAKVEEVHVDSHGAPGADGAKPGADASRPRVRTSGHGITSILVAEAAAKQGAGSSTEGLPKVDINGASATELRTALGTVLSFERGGVRYLVAGWLPSSTVEAFARGL